MTRHLYIASDENETGTTLTDWVARLDDERRLPQLIAEQLTRAIVEGRVASGTRLSETEIAEAFGTSRTPAREALQSLERELLVERTPRKGAHVTHVSAEQALDVYVCRAYLYGLSARLAASKLSAGQLGELSEILEEMDDASESEDTSRYFHLNVRFHAILASATGNVMLLRLMEGMGGLTLRFRHMSVTIPGRVRESVKQHHELLSALLDSDGARAERAVRQTIVDAGDAVMSHFFGVDDRPVQSLVFGEDRADT